MVSKSDAFLLILYAAILASWIHKSQTTFDTTKVMAAFEQEANVYSLDVKNCSLLTGLNSTKGEMSALVCMFPNLDNISRLANVDFEMKVYSAKNDFSEEYHAALMRVIVKWSIVIVGITSVTIFIFILLASFCASQKCCRQCTPD